MTRVVDPAYSRSYYQRNREAILARKRKHYEQNREKILARESAYKERDRTAINFSRRRGIPVKLARELLARADEWRI